MCDKTFYRQANVNKHKHKRTIHKIHLSINRSIECLECNFKSFSSVKELRTHLQGYHKMLMMEEVKKPESILVMPVLTASAGGKVVSNVDLKGQSSNQISIKEEKKIKVDEQQLYYLPSQTDFGAHVVTRPGSVSSTSPPHISIEPVHVHTKGLESTSVLYEGVPIKEYNAASQCVSETPVIELESRFLFPSTDAVKESVIMSGHLEVASKTSSIEEASEEVSKPSVVLQGTEFHSHTMTDL